MPSPFKYLRGISAWMVAFLFGCGTTCAQEYPVDVITTLNAPYSVWISDYTELGGNNIQTLITFKDFNEPAFNAKLKLTITSNALTLQTVANFTPTSPLVLTPGVPLQLSGSDLSEYFDYNNLSYSGISRNTLESTGKLPEGQYTFCLQVLDYITGKPISRKGCASAWIQLKDQPLVIAPTCGDPVLPGTSTNILFQWQNSGSLSQNSALSTEYQLTLMEVTNATTAPMNAIANNHVLQVFQSMFQNQTTYVYGPSDPPLDLGKRYVWRVQAKDEKGFDSFKNNGYTEPCWFYYGYPEGGSIALTQPEDAFNFTKNDQAYFKCSAPDNRLTGQQVAYTLTIVEVNQGQDAETAMANNTPWHEETSNASGSPNGSDFLLQDSIPKTKKFAWKVTGNTGEQVVAESEVFTFTGPPLIEEFEAGEHKVVVTELYNNDFSSLDGSGYIMIGEGDSNKVAIEFEELDIDLVAGKYVLNNGDIVYDATSMNTIALAAQHEDVPDATFIPQEVRLTDQALDIKGVIKVPLPLAVNSNETAYLVSDPTYLNFDQYQLNGSQFAPESGNTFELLDPLGFIVNYDETTEIIVADNEFVLKLGGTLIMPAEVKTPSGGSVSIVFTEQDDFLYGTANALADAPIYLMNGSPMFLQPTKAVMDFSENESPGTHAGDDAWTGLYILESELTLPAAIDDGEQAYLAAETVLSSDLDQSYIERVEVTGTGLDFEMELTESEELYCTVNGYVAQITSLKLDVAEGALSDGYLEADAALPFVSDAQLFQVRLPIEEDGFGAAYFPETIEETVVFDAGKERETSVSIKNVAFDEEGLLDMTVSISGANNGLEVNNIPEFKVTPSGQTGFGEVGGIFALETTASASVGNIPIEIDSVAIGNVGGTFGVAAAGSIGMGANVSGPNGAPRTSLTSILMPPAEGSAHAGVFDAYNAATGTSTTGAQASASGSASTATTTVSGNASATTTVQTNSQGTTASTDVSAGAAMTPGLYNDLAKAIPILKQQELSVSASAGSSTTVMSNGGYKMTTYVDIDATVAFASGKLEFEVNPDWGGVFMGQLGFGINGAIIPVPYFEDLEAQVILGAHKSGVPIYLLRTAVGVKIPIATPYIGLDGFSFAVGQNVAPETFLPEEPKPASELEWAVDMNTPMAVYLDFGISDQVPEVSGIVYTAGIGGGGRVEMNGAMTDPYAIPNLCLSMNLRGGLFNFASGPLAIFLADRSAIRIAGNADLCLGESLEMNTNVQANAMMIVGIPNPLGIGLPICAEAAGQLHFKIPLSKMDNPSSFVNDFEYSVKLGSESNRVNVDAFCDPGLEIANGWFHIELDGPNLHLNTGLGMQIQKSIRVPQIPVGFTGDYIAPYFELDSRILGTTDVTLGMGDINSPSLQLDVALAVHAYLYTTAGVEYKFGTIEDDLNLGTVTLEFNGEFKAGTTSKQLVLAGDFMADVSVLGTSYEVEHEGEIAVNL